jgi:hypothetical protein
MKDMPTLLCASLSKRAPRLHEAVFARVIDNARTLRTYVQILRSGVVGRKSLGSAPKRLVREWLASRDEDALFSSGAGQNPPLSDIVKDGAPQAGGTGARGILRLHARPVLQLGCIAKASGCSSSSSRLASRWTFRICRSGCCPPCRSLGRIG